MRTDLLNLLWYHSIQVTIVVLLLGGMARLVSRRSPHLAHCLLLVALVKCVTPPIFSLPTGLFCWGQELVGYSHDREGSPGRELSHDSLRPDLIEIESNTNESGKFVESLIEEENESFSLITTYTEESLVPIEKELDLGSQETLEFATQEKVLWHPTVVLVWEFGAIIFLIIPLGLLWRCQARIRSHVVPYKESLKKEFVSLCGSLRIRWPVRLCVTRARISPSVVGLINPTVVLPDSLVGMHNEQALRPILAHELVHIRRGDLTTSLVQSFARAVCWFHPAVYWLNREIHRESERCCDEEVLAELQCSPSVYGNLLLDVMSQKFVPVPVLPGIKAVEITRKRMEYLMKVGNRGSRRMPWWCWSLFCLLGILVIPGAGFDEVQGQEDQQLVPIRGNQEQLPGQGDQIPEPIQRTQARTLPTSAADVQSSPLPKSNPQPASASVRSSPRETGERIERSYPVEELFQKLSDQSKGSLTRDLITVCSDTVKRKDPSGKIEFSEGKLRVNALPAAHADLSDTLKSWGNHGLQGVIVQSVILSAPRDFLDTLCQSWNLESREDLKSWSTLLTPNQLDDLKAGIKGNTHVTRLSSPQIRSLNGYQSHFQIGSERPYKIIRTGHPDKTRSISEGLSLRVVTLKMGDKYQLDFVSEDQKILGTNKISLTDEETGEEQVVELPNLSVARTRLRAELGSGQTILVTRNETGPGNRERIHLVTILDVPPDTHENIETKATQDQAFLDYQLKQTRESSISDAPIDAPIRTLSYDRVQEDSEKLTVRIYSVADLIVPIPNGDLYVGDNSATHDTKASPISFEPLIAFIQKKVPSEEWAEDWSILPVSNNLSLVVICSNAAHDRIAELLEGVRKKQDLQVVLEMGWYQLDPKQAEELKFGEGDELQVTESNNEEVQKIVSGGKSNTIPKLTLFSKQSCKMLLPVENEDGSDSGQLLRIAPVVSRDGSSVSLKATLGEQINLSQVWSGKIKDGEALLVRLTGLISDPEDLTKNTKHPKGELLLGIRARIVRPEPEDELRATSTEP